MIDIELLFVGDNRMFGIEVVHKNGSKDWYDPIEAGGITETETEYLINNGGFDSYHEPKDNVVELLRYEICQNCYRTLERCECHDRGDSDNGDRDPHDADMGGGGISRVPGA